MKKDIEKYIAWCQNCQQVKAEHQHPSGLLYHLCILEWKWEIISMEFIIGLPMTVKRHDSIMVVVDKLSKVDHFITVKSTHKASDIAGIFLKEVFILHGLPMEIISSRDAKFTSNS